MSDIGGDLQDCADKANHLPHVWMDRDTFPMLHRCQGVRNINYPTIIEEKERGTWPPNMETKSATPFPE